MPALKFLTALIAKEAVSMVASEVQNRRSSQQSRPGVDPYSTHGYAQPVPPQGHPHMQGPQINPNSMPPVTVYVTKDNRVLDQFGRPVNIVHVPIQNQN